MADEIAAERSARRSRGRILAPTLEHPAVGRSAIVARLDGEDEDAPAGEPRLVEQRLVGSRIEHASVDRGPGLERHEHERKAAGDLLDRQAVRDRPRLEAEHRGHAVAGLDRRTELRRLLRHPGLDEVGAIPLEVHRCGTEAEPEDEAPLRRLDPALVGERERRPDHGVAGERHLALLGAEDPKADIGAGLLGREDERALREVHLAGDAGHVVRGEIGRSRENGELVAGEGPVREDVVVQVAMVGNFHATTLSDGPVVKQVNKSNADHERCA
jgi:hypothetical protein